MFYDFTASGKRIRELRVQKGLTQEQLSDLLYCSRTTVTLIENGQKGCSVQMLMQFACALDSTMDYIAMGRSPEREALKDRITGLISEMKEIENLL